MLDRVDKDGAWATPALDGELARAGLDERDRRLAAELVYGVLRHRTRLDRALAGARRVSRRRRRAWSPRCASPRIRCCSSIACRATPPSTMRSRAARDVGGAEARRLRERGAAQGRRAAGEPALPAIRARGSRSSTRCRAGSSTSSPRGRADQLAATAAAFARLGAARSRAANRRRTTRDGADRSSSPSAGVTARRSTSTAHADGAPPRGPRRSGAQPSFLAGPWTVQDAGAQLVGARSPRRARASASSTRAPASAASPRTSPSSPTMRRTIDAADQSRDQARAAAPRPPRASASTSIQRHAVRPARSGRAARRRVRSDRPRRAVHRASACCAAIPMRSGA